MTARGLNCMQSVFAIFMRIVVAKLWCRLATGIVAMLVLSHRQLGWSVVMLMCHTVS